MAIHPLVWGEGSPDAKIVIVGEALGAKEVIKRRPFIGPAGDRLMEVLHLVGLTRQDVYLTNVVKERPGQNDNDISDWFSINSRTGSVTVSAEFREYVVILKEELSKLRANVFVAAGNVPMYAMTGQIRVMKRRGSILEGNFWPGMKVIPTVHPRTLIDVWINRHLLRMDLKRAIEESAYPDIRLPERHLIIEPSFIDSRLYLQDILDNYSLVGVDIEVMNEEVSCISFAKSASDVICIPFLDKGTNYFDPDQELNIWLLIGRILSSPDIKKIFQNGAFDTSFIFRRYGIVSTNCEDTMLQMGLVYPDFPKGLDFITAMFTKEPYYKDDGKKWFKLGGSQEDFWRYNCKDSAVLQEIYPALDKELVTQDNKEAYMWNMKLYPILTYMQERGILCDKQGLVKASEDAQKEIVRLTEELHKCCGFAINPRSPQQLVNYFYTQKGLPAYTKFDKKTRTSHATTDVDALKRISRKGHKEAGLVLNIRKWTKLDSTYFNVKLSEDSRLRSAMDLRPRNGRLSSGEDIFGEGTNMQNQPEIMRKFLLADPGYVMYNMDLSQAENRIVAYIAPELTMIDAFESKKDVHSMTGGLISGLDPAEVKRQDKEGIKCDLGNGDQTWRYWGKKSNHGLNYDEGFRTFALKNEISESQAKWIIARYHQVYPGIRKYHSWIRAELHANNRTLTNLLGMKQMFLDEWGDSMFRVAYNYIPSSSVACIINRRGLCFIYYNQQWFRPVEILNQVHDSILFQIPLSVPWEKHAEIIMRIKVSLETPLYWRGREFVIPSDITMGLNWHKKSMKDVIVEETDTCRSLGKKLSDIYSEITHTEIEAVTESDLADIDLEEQTA